MRLGISQLINCAYNFLYSYCGGGGARLKILRNGLIAKFPGTYESGLGKKYAIVPCGFQKSDLISTLVVGYFTANHNLCNVGIFRGQPEQRGFSGNILFSNLDYS